MKRFLMSTYVFLCSILVIPKPIFAEENYFGYTINQNHVPHHKELEIEFIYNLEGYKEDEFAVRPVLEASQVEILKTPENFWVGQQALWSEMPKLKKKMRIKLNFSGSSDLYFQIQNTTKPVIYKTESKTIWGQGFNKNYIDNLNKNIKNYVFRQEESQLVRKKESARLQKVDKPGLLAKMIKYIDEII